VLVEDLEDHDTSNPLFLAIPEKLDGKTPSYFSNQAKNASPNKHPIPSMYGIFTYIYHKNQPNVGKYTIHGWY